MRMNVARKIKEIDLKPKEFLLPLFEVIVNAVHAIEERNINDGKISIEVIRDTSIKRKEMFETNKILPIKSFIVKDNGIGFNRNTFAAFQNAYTDYKLKKGGKGVGRFTVLKAFEKMHIESYFQEDGHHYKRIFEFDADNEVQEIHFKEYDTDIIETIVTLQSYLPEYKKNTTIEISEIAERIVEHCLIYYLTNSMPEVILYENGNDNSVCLYDLYKQFLFHNEIESIKLDKHIFEMYFLKKEKRQKNHYLHFCAHNRIVETYSIKKYIPNFYKPIKENGKDFFLSIYVTGQYFNDNLNELRNSFNFPKKISDKQTSLIEQLSSEEILLAIKFQLEKKYKSFLDEIDCEKLKKVKKFILDEEGIEYRHLLNTEEELKKISPENLTDDKLDLELHKINYELEKKHKQKVKKILVKGLDNYDEYYLELQNILRRENEFTHSKLANYVVRRKAILEVFDKFLDIQNDNKYKREEALHNIIFPMGEESDTLPYNQHNLWLIDERLTFHTYIASDKAISSLKPLESSSRKEPDLTIFDTKWVYTPDDNFSSLVIFEFKRPGRLVDTDIDDQIIKYFKEIMKGKAKTYNGRYIDIEDNTPKFGYIVCSISKAQGEELKRWKGYKLTPNKTLFRYLEKTNLYIEILTFEQILRFARERHKIFFKMLGIDRL